jgi:hypothetical protein
MNAKWTVLIGLAVLLLCQSVLRADEPDAAATTLSASGSDVFAELYEHLADSIIEIRATEDNLVKGLLAQYHASAQRHLAEAAEAGAKRVAHLEAAAAEIANIANEGDKRVRAVRQRLSNAGHYHQKDTETAEDYMFINSAEKMSLFALAKKVGRLGADAKPADINTAREELKSLFAKAIGRD